MSVLNGTGGRRSPRDFSRSRRHLRLLLVSVAIIFGASTVYGQSTSFTYQGRLTDGAGPANGAYDLQFTLWDSNAGGNPQPQPGPVTVTRGNVSVTNGAFTVQLDFGVAGFPGADRFLEISVRQHSVDPANPPYTTLAPRQQITSTPYATRSLASTSADSATNAAQLGGVPASQFVQTTDARLSDPRPPASGSGNYIQNSTAPQAASNFNVSGDGTAGGTLSASAVNATTQFNLGGSRILSGSSDANTFAGIGAGVANPIGGGGFNSFFGYGAGIANTAGFGNSFFGSGAGGGNTTGNQNSFFGIGAGSRNTTAPDNSFVGAFAGQSNTTGESNSFFGASAGANNTTGNNNSFFGKLSGFNNGANFNSFFGFGAGQQDTTGFHNVVVGSLAGQAITTGNNNTIIGDLANGTANITNSTAIGANALVTRNNSLVLGSIAGVNGATSSLNVGIGTTAPAFNLHLRGDGITVADVQSSNERAILSLESTVAGLNQV